MGREGVEFGLVFTRQGAVHLGQPDGVDGHIGQNGVDHAHIGHVQQKLANTRLAHTGLCQLNDFQIGFHARMTVNFSPQLHGLTAGLGAVDARVHHRAAVAQAGDPGAVEQMGVDAGHLWRAVGAQTQGTTRELVHQFEGLQIQGLAGAREQRLEVFDHGRHDQLVTITTGGIEQGSSEFFDVARLRGQHIGNVIRQDPGGHGHRGCF